MRSSSETIETRRLKDARTAVKKTARQVSDVVARIDDPETGLDEAFRLGHEASEIIRDPDGPVQQALGEAAAARDEARAAQDAADDALEDASRAQTTADGKNAVYRRATRPAQSTVNPLVQGDLLFLLDSSGRTSAIEVWNGTQWVPNTILADSILVPGSLGAVSIRNGAITGPLIDSETITAENLAAGAATMAKLTIGDTSNLVDDPTFMHQSWSIPTGVSYYSASEGTAIRFTNGPSIQTVRSSAYMGIAPGDQFLIRARVYNRAPGATLNIRVAWLDSSGAIIGNSANASTPGSSNNTWETRVVAVEAPAGAAGLRFTAAITASNIPTSNPLVLFREPQVLRRSNGELIVDGSISANKLLVDQAFIDKLFVNSLFVDTLSGRTIQALTIRTATLQSADIDAGTIDGVTITGGTIQTTSATNRGIKLSSSSLRAYDSSGNQTFYVSSSSGSVEAAGTFTSGSGANIAQLSGTAFGIMAGVRLGNFSSTSLPQAVVGVSVNNSDGYPLGATLVISEETTANSSGRSELLLRRGGGFWLKNTYGSYANIGISSSGYDLTLSGRLSADNYSNDMVVRGSALSGTAPILTWTVTYPGAPVNGTRMPIVTPIASSAEGTTIATRSWTSTGFTAEMRGQDGDTKYFRYLAIWTESF